MVRYVLTAALLLATSGTGGSATGALDSNGWTALGRERLGSADQLGAIEAADRALQIDANNVRAIELHGELVRSQFGLVGALIWFERGLQIDPDNVSLLEEYGATLGEAGRYRDMLKVARRIIALDSDNSRAFYMQAVLAARAGDYALAKRILPLAGDAFNEIPGPMLLDAICEYELGNYNRSVDKLQRLVAIQPNNSAVRTLLAQAMYRAGNPLDALDIIRPIAERSDADSYSLMLAARSFEASNQRERSSGAIDDAMQSAIRPVMALAEQVTLTAAAAEARRSPNDARAVVPYIRALMAAGDLDVAFAEAARMQEANAGVADAHLLVGDVELSRGRLAEAIAAFGQARAISFDEPVMLRLVDALSRAGDEIRAGRTLAEYLAFNPTSLTALRLAGYRALDAGDWKLAVALLERVRSRIGYNDYILLANLARSYSAAGRHEAAVADAAIAYRIAPASAMVTHVYGQVLLKSSKRPKAVVELLEKAAIMMPENAEVAAELKRARAAHKRAN